MRICFASLFAVVLSAAASQAARVPAPDPLQGDGGVSDFYTWTDGDVPATRAGCCAPSRSIRRSG